MRADVVVADRLDRLDARRRRSSLARARRSSAGDGASSISFWWRRWIEHSRSPRCDRVAVLVGEDLDLDVARALDVPLQVHVAGCRTPACASAARRRAAAPSSCALLVDDLHAAPAAAGRRLEDHREADRARGRLAPASSVVEHAGAGQRPARPPSPSPRARATLSPIRRITSGGGPMKCRPHLLARPRRTRRSRRGSRSRGGSASAPVISAAVMIAGMLR